MPDSQSSSAPPRPAEATPPVTHPVGVLYEIRWSEICPWLILVQALRVSLWLRVLALALVGVWITQWGAQGIAAVCDSPVLLGNLESTSPTHPSGWSAVLDSPLARGWQWPLRPFAQAVNGSAPATTWTLLLYGLLQGLWMLAVWALFGGAITRIAALHLTRGEKLGPLAALRASIVVWPSTLGAPLLVLLMACGWAIPLALLGWLMRSDLLAVVVGIVWCLALVWGLGLVALLLGLVLGWPLMWACTGVERSDGFDGVSRAFAYVFQRPLRLAFYLGVSLALAWVGGAVVDWVTTTTVSTTEATVAWGAGNAPWGTLEGQSSWPARLMQGWSVAVRGLAGAYPLACLWPFAVGIYLLMRRDVDSIELDEVTLSAAQESNPGQTPDNGAED